MDAQHNNPTKKRKMTPSKATEKVATSKAKNANGAKGRKKVTGKIPKDDKKAKLSPTVRFRREAIIKVLMEHKILTEEEGQDRIENPENIADQKIGKRPRINNHIGDLGSGEKSRECFNYFVNFKCDDAEVLDEKLQTPLNQSVNNFDDSCLYLEEDDVDEDGDMYTVDTMPVGLYVSKFSLDSYWSFCRDEILLEDHDSHCMTCGYCCDWRHECGTSERNGRGGRRGFGGFMGGFGDGDSDDSEDSDAEKPDCVLQ